MHEQKGHRARYTKQFPQKFCRQQVFPFGFLFRDNLCQNRAGEVFTAFGINNNKINVVFYHFI